MQIESGVPLADYSTMRLGGPAAYLAEVHNTDELSEAVSWASKQSLPIIMIGGGSNIFWKDEGFLGLVLVNKIKGYQATEYEDGSVEITIGAGEIWDKVVDRTVQAGLTGIEALSLIPGTVGGTPVQNVGAYGQEISQTLVDVHAFDIQTGEFVGISGVDCGFGYRSSRFKFEDRGRFFITGITLRLQHANPLPPFYPALTRYLTDHAVTEYTPQTIRDAVIAIRSAKLPDPAVVANNGSFFANPVVGHEQAAAISAAAGTEVPQWPTPEDLVKIPAAWLVEQAGFKDFHDPETGMGTWPAQSLVLVNEKARSTADLLAFKQKIVDAVRAQFGVELVQEPELLP
jgi:UDP-N-acetylmuramate dehydrogenase